jgi:hypothetical protein
MAGDQQPSQAVRGTEIVGAFLKHWPAKDAPLPVQIAFYEELQRAVEPFAAGEDQEARWFSQLGRELSRNLTAFRQLATQLTRESEWAKNRLDSAVDKVPRDLQRVLRQARS